MGLGKLAKIYLKEKLAFLGYLLWRGICELSDSEVNVLRFLPVKISAELVMESKILVYPL
jgi:hypothetical protein